MTLGRKQLMILAVTISLVLAMLPFTALAGWTWCRSDPIIHVNSTQFSVNVAITDTQENQVNGPVAYHFTIASGVTHTVDRDGVGLNGYGDTITWHLSGTAGHLIIHVAIPVTGSAISAELSVQKGDGTPVIYNGYSSGITADVTFP